MPKVLHGRLTKNTLGGVDDQAVGSKETKDSTEVLEVGGTGRGGDENVVQINKTVWEMAKYSVHESLEGLCRVAEAERHPKELEQAEGSDDGGFGNMLGIHGNLEIALGQIQLTENSAAMEICRKILDIGEWVAIMLGA